MAFRRIGSTAFIACALIALAAPVLAQRDTTRIAGDSARALLLPEIVVTATQTPVRTERVGFAIGAVMPADLALRRPPTAADALRDAAGAFIDEAAGPGGPTIIRLRGGEEVFTQILIDGVQVNENGGFFDFQGLVPSNIDRIEVARGPQSALYGSSAVSGVVSFLSPRGVPGPTRWSVYGEGSGATENGRGWRATGDASGGTDRLAFSAGGGVAYARGVYDQPHDTRSRDASLRLDAAPARNIELTGTARFLGMDGNLPVRDPGATRVPLDPNARNERDRFVSALTARWNAPSGKLSQHLRTSLLRENFVYQDERDNVLDETGELPYFVFDFDFTLDSRRSRSTVEYGGSITPVDAAKVSYGAQWQRESLRDNTAGDFGDGRQHLDRESRAAFAEVLLAPAARVDVIAGVRVEKFQGIDAAWTPRASIVFDALPERIALRAAAGRAFKAPNLQQQYLDNPFIRSNPDLAPETSTSWELGADVRDGSGRVALALTYFDQQFDDLIRTVAIEGSETGQTINRNLGESSARGIEWDAAWRAQRDWTVGARGSWVRTRVIDGVGLDDAQYPEDEPLPFRPSAVHTAYIETTALASVTARFATTFVGEQTVLRERFSGPREPIDGYMLAGVALRWLVRPGVALHGRIDNLLDTEYETAFDRPGAPLNVALGVRVGT
jgi:vitamin B12 transporter